MTPARFQTRALVLGIVLALLFVPATSLAAHNSVGAHVSIAQADEVASDGSIVADIDPNGELRTAWHTNLDTPRLDPPDQTGDRYTGACDKPAQFDTDAAYEDALRNGDACYIGLLDQQMEYVLNGIGVLLMKQPSDSLYQANPEAGDTHCRGGGNPVDRVNRALNDPECSGSGHPQFIPGDVLVDTDLLEAPTQGNGNIPGAGDLLSKNEGSGYNFLPFLMTPYIFLFGQPHPDTPADNRSGFEAGQGPFGPDQGPLFDITGACGDRTQDCVLLTPEDIENYDLNAGTTGVPSEDLRARVCAYLPQFAILGGGDDRAAGLCGIFGSLVDQYVETDGEGGLALPGAPDTWIATQPGWYQGVNIITAGEVSRFGGAFHTVDKHQCATNDPSGTLPHLKADDCDGQLPAGVIAQVAVNPAVPSPNHPLWCVRPNILAHGDEAVAGVNDPGLYGDFIADAIDVDIHRPLFNSEYQTAMGITHPVVRGVLDNEAPQVEPAVRDASDSAGDLAAAGSIGDALDGLVEDNSPDPGLTDLYYRADGLESNNPPNLAEPFEVTRAAGVQCDSLGVVQVVDEETTIDGDLVFNVGISQSTVSLKDYTLSDGDLPAREDETTEGAWMAEQYSFGGAILGFLDTSVDGGDEPGAQFSGCATASGQPQPEADFCAWKGLWDAYNPDCTNIDSDPCSDILEGRNYNLTAGVGLYFVAKVSGPVVVTSEVSSRPNENVDRFGALGLDNPTAQNCIVGFSFGFEGTPAVDAGDVLNAACPGHAENDGRTLVLQDAFNDQSVTNPGTFSAAIDILKLVPTPEAGITATGIGVGDELCVTGIWNVEDGEVASDTAGLGDLELDGAGSPHSWTDCVPFESSA